MSAVPPQAARWNRRSLMRSARLRLGFGLVCLWLIGVIDPSAARAADMQPFIDAALAYLRDQGIDTERKAGIDVLEWEAGERETQNRVVVIVRFMGTAGYAVVSLRAIANVITSYTRGRVPHRDLTP